MTYYDHGCGECIHEDDILTAYVYMLSKLSRFGEYYTDSLGVQYLTVRNVKVTIDHPDLHLEHLTDPVTLADVGENISELNNFANTKKLIWDNIVGKRSVDSTVIAEKILENGKAVCFLCERGYRDKRADVLPFKNVRFINMNSRLYMSVQCDSMLSSGWIKDIYHLAIFHQQVQLKMMDSLPIGIGTITVYTNDIQAHRSEIDSQWELLRKLRYLPKLCV
jgi:hypothetical protein